MSQQPQRGETGWLQVQIIGISPRWGFVP